MHGTGYVSYISQMTPRYGCFVLRATALRAALQDTLGACNYQGWAAYQVERAKKEAYMDLLRIIIAILLPPLGVFLQVGIGKQFWINILLTILGYIPGIIHAVWVIAKY
jgi:uncharacterized membrane protein YqaE (UPF0057 family)